MRLIALPIAAALVISAGVSAHAQSRFLSDQGLVVSGTASQFTVQFRAGEGAKDYWCAAGDFVIRRLGMGPTTQIARISPPPRSQGQGIDFSVDPSAMSNAPADSFATGMAHLPGGNSMSAAHSVVLCALDGIVGR